MSEVLQALYEFWSQFGIPAYLSDQVSEKATYPYITYTAETAGLCNGTVLTAFNWHTSNEERREMLDKIAKAIPVGGVVRNVGDGYIHIFRNPAGFQSIYASGNDQDANEQKKVVVCGRTSIEVYFYNI